MLNPAISFINQLFPLSPGLIEYIERHIKTKNLPKNSLILQAGQIAENVYFIEQGFLRFFYKKLDK